ncbi:MAG TPA: hypothetical protein VKT30_14820 [Caulobacteraceae bacterium]|nr:hypothetical protein [Caulobacteraceae bacterium]
MGDDVMRKVVTIIGAVGLIGMLAACEDYGCGPYGEEACYGYGYGPGYYGPGPYYNHGYYDRGYYDQSYYNGPYYGGTGAYDAYYDDYYGPFYDGYWGPDGFFYFSLGPGRGFRRDVGGHFRHDTASGFHGIRGMHHR